tara:strand:+ start:101 stop:730 length:630 start_codon:yes stop_codon:yes gene_type:complete
MSTRKTIAWESWNAKLEGLQQELIDENEPTYLENEHIQSSELVPTEMFITPPRVIHTPLGVYPEDSLLKPSDRWDCWIGHTNFDITNNVASRLDSDVDGIEALKILGRYSFFIGIGKLFDIAQIRKDIENLLCIYTEQEVLNDKDRRVTVDLVKEQLESKKYWSLFVSPEGEVNYVVSDKMDKHYLDGLNNLLEMKSLVGGIILRGDNG